MRKNPENIVLDNYEMEILEAYQKGELKPSESKTDFHAIAVNTIKKHVYDDFSQLTNKDFIEMIHGSQTLHQMFKEPTISAIL